MTFEFDAKKDDEQKSKEREYQQSGQSGPISPHHLKSPRDVLALQRTYGNKAVQRMLENRHVQRDFLGNTMEAVNQAVEEARARAAVTAFDVTVTQPLTFRRDVDDPTVGFVDSRVDVVAQFDPDQVDVSKMEYRQYIKGHVELDDLGSGRTFDLDGHFANLPAGRLTADWQEDGDTSLGEGMAGYHYGHRDYEDHGGGDRDRYFPDRETGDTYIGYDYPALGPIPATAGDRGDVLRWRMNFRGVILYDGVVVGEKFWNIQGTITIPEASVDTVVAS